MRDTIIDVSRWNGELDFGQLKREAAAQGDNLLGVIIKAYEWGYGIDPMLETHYRNARREPGFKTGFYSFAHIDSDPVLSAQQFCDAIATKTAEIGVYDDFEDNAAIGRGPGVVSAHVNAWCAEVERVRPGQVGVYGGAYADWSPSLQVAPRSFWLAAYTAQIPPVPPNLGAPMIWQRDARYLGRDLDYSVVLDPGRLANMSGAPPKPVPNDVKMRFFQAVLHTAQTGKWNADTASRADVIREMRLPSRHANSARVKYAQQVMAFDAAHTDGRWGPLTNGKWVDTVVKLQTSMGMTATTGRWDDITEFCYRIMQTFK